MESIKGVVSQTFYSSPTFSTGRLRRPDGEEARFAGKLFLRAGEAIVASGSWIEHEVYGKQFQIDDVQVDGELDARGLAAWLSLHPDAVGIGPARAAKVADAFGSCFEDALRNRPEEVAAVAGVKVENIHLLAASWAARAGYNAVATKLAASGLTKFQIDSLIESCGSTVVQALQEDPYSVLGRVPGFGFKRVDDIARKSYGVLKDNERRIEAGIIWCLKQALEEGHTCVSRPDLCTAAEKALFLDNLDAEYLICKRIDALEQQKRIEILRSGPGYYALPWISKMETLVARFLATGKCQNPFWNELQDADLGKHLGHLDEYQREAALTALEYRITVMSGGAGCGKTTTIKAIANVYEACGLTVEMCCPTGKAARRLSQVSGRRAKTIHRTLEYSPKKNEFERNEHSPIAADVIIVDEVSMVDIQLAWNLFKAIGPTTAVLLVGDHHQLPPVGPGSLLRDCIRNKLVPTKILSHCHRQAGVLKSNCSAILDGEIRFEKAAPAWYVDSRHQSGDTDSILAVIERLWTELIPQWGFDVLLDTQILSGMHRGEVGTRNVNTLLQKLHQKTLGVHVAEPAEDDDGPPRLYVGDKVLCTKNNYQLDIFNGMQGLVKSVKPFVVTFEGRDVVIPPECRNIIALAYCLTPHKCQGSEWGCIAVICAKEQTIMLSRNWLYTAVTRAQRTLVLVGDKHSIELAARRVQPNNRCTILSLGNQK